MAVRLQKRKVGFAAGLLGLACVLLAPESRADFLVNEKGSGAIILSVWSNPNRPPQAPNFHKEAEIENGGGSAKLGPGLKGSDPLTGIGLTLGPNWASSVDYGKAAGGDSIDYGADNDLYTLVTPVSAVATITLDVSGEATGSTTVLFTGHWSGSDTGTAERLQWFDVSDPDHPLMLDQLLRVGPFDEGISKTITIRGGVENLILVGDGVAESVVPEPASLVLLGLGVVGVAGFARPRPKRTSAGRD